MTTEPTIFARILDGEVPCHKLYENDYVLSFLDVSPIAHGHTLLIPKQRVAQLHELDEEHAVELGRALPTVAKAVMAATGAEYYNILQNNGEPAYQSVFHVHFHIVPRIGQEGLWVDWSPGSLANGETLAASIREHL